MNLGFNAIAILCVCVSVKNRDIKCLHFCILSTSLKASCWKVPSLVLTRACVTSHLSLSTGQLVTMAAVKPTQQLTDVLGTTSVLEASTPALKNKWSCMFSSLRPSMHWLTDVRQLFRVPRWPLYFPGFLLSPANRQQFNLREARALTTEK